jgi:hypothetical protein
MKCAELNSPEVRSVCRQTICVLPLGATEHHGLHVELAITIPLIGEWLQAHWPNAPEVECDPSSSSRLDEESRIAGHSPLPARRVAA